MSALDENVVREKDPTRLCPTCRMPISTLAIRCRFCGAEVGRPRKEQETFTVKDLGGEEKSSYALSGNVTEALESFLMEERAQIEAKERERQEAANRSLFRRPKKPQDSVVTDGRGSSPGLPELDAERRDLASVSSSTSQSKLKALQEPSPIEVMGKRLLIGAALVAGLVILYFGAEYAWAHMRAYMNPPVQETEVIYPNRAQEILAGTGNIVEALEEALTALRYNNTPENRDIAESMRRLFIEDVEARAFANPFDMTKLNSASSDIARIAQRDMDASVQQLAEIISREVADFKFILTRIDGEDDTAVFRLNNPFLDEREQIVAPGDLLQDRFLVKRITSRMVELEDMSARGGGRRLVSRPMASVSAN